MHSAFRRLPALMILAAALPVQAAEMLVEIKQVDDVKAVFATVESVDVIAARARIAGTVAALLVDEGSAVQAGDRIAVIGDPKLALATTGIDARLKAAEAQRDLAEIEYRRAGDLLNKGAATKARVDDARTQLDVAGRTIAALKAERAASAERSSEAAVLAPASGRVLKVPTTQGAVVMAGETVALLAADNFVLRMALPERHARFIKTGDAVQVGARALDQSGTPLRPGTVRQVYPLIENGRVTADVAVEGLGDYFVGERVPVHVAAGKRPAILLPREATQRRFGVDYVRVKGIGPVAVQLGQVMGDQVEILSGLRAGDTAEW